MIAKAWQLGWLRAEATRLLADAAGFEAGPKQIGDAGLDRDRDDVPVSPLHLRAASGRSTRCWHRC